MSNPKRFYVSVSADAVPSIDEIMCLIGKLPYLDLIDLAGMLGADADKIADAHGDWLPEDEADE